jgi:hypothetical protein
MGRFMNWFLRADPIILDKKFIEQREDEYVDKLVRTHFRHEPTAFVGGFLSPKRYAEEKKKILNNGFDYEGEEVARKTIARCANQPSLCQGKYNVEGDLEERRRQLLNNRYVGRGRLSSGLSRVFNFYP